MEVASVTNRQFAMDIVDQSHAGEARRAAAELAEFAGLNDTDRGKIAIAVTEMATNIVKHAKHGKMLFETLGHNGASGLRVLSLDKGPGIGNVSMALEDGYSSYGSSGNGLGAVRRLSTVFDLYSAPNLGTCILAEFWPEMKNKNSGSSFSLGVVSVAMRGETMCGDGWGMRASTDHSFFMVVDGLGHGMFASDAAREAERVLRNSNSNSAADILGDCHGALRKTRGAAGAIAQISQDKGLLTYAGIGNIAATLIDGEKRRGIASHNGTLGHQLHKIQEFTLPWNKDSVLIMHSDGLSAKWDFSQYPGLLSKRPSVIAAVLYRDFQRERDDATVMVARNQQ